MGFFRGLLGKKKEGEGEAFIPAPAQAISGLEPIVVQAIESLFPDLGQQEMVMKYALDYKRECRSKTGRDDLKGLLSMLAYSKGRAESLPAPSRWFDGRFRIEEIDHVFRGMKDAEEWVRSIVKTQA
jgi:hypothetical protein